jgi:hypothetical protein
MNTEQRDKNQAMFNCAEAMVKTLRTGQRDTSHLNQQEPDAVKDYWKDKEGKCLACDAEIAVEESYCKSCESFLLEMYAQQEANNLRIEMEHL